MKQKSQRLLRWIVPLIIFLLCMSATAALAVNATYADVNGETIDAASPYWKNGGGGSAADWNAFFDTSTAIPTLWLKDAVIDTLSAFDELIYADGDLVLKLLGYSILSYTGDAEHDVAGLAVEGNLWIEDGTIDQSGRMDISINNFAVPYDYICGICTYNSLTINGGTIDILLAPAIRVEGVFAEIGESITINGGKTTIYGWGLSASGVSADLFVLAGGEILCAVDGIMDPGSCALEFLNLLATGGFGEFISEEEGFGAIWYLADEGYFRVIDGRLIFSGVNEALAFDTDLTLVPYVTDRIYASTDFEGADKFLWDPSKGVLAGNRTEYSEFSYIELLGNGVVDPQTGDGSHPWLWLGAGLAALLLGTGAGMLRRKQSV